MPGETKKVFKDVPVQTLVKRFEESKEYRKKYEKDWDRARDMYDGKQWAAGSKIAWFQSEPVYNKVAEYVELMRGYLSDNKWGVDVAPISVPDDTDADKIMNQADKVNKLLDFLWTDNRTQNKLAQVLQYVFQYGTGFIKSTFDPDNIGDRGIGQIEDTVVSPWYIFPDPDATCVQDAAFIIEHHPVSMRWVIDRYPEKAEEVRAAGETSKTEYNERKGDSGRGPAPTGEGKRLDILECWYRDSSIVEDAESETGVTLQYPDGRHTLMTVGGIVLDDGPCLYGMWPYARFVDILRPAEFFGDCTLHKALGIQETINTILRAIIDNGLWLIHGIWVGDNTSGVNPKSIAGYGPRGFISKNPGTDVHRETGPPLPSHIFEMLNQQCEAFDQVVGISPILRGEAPGRQPVQTVMLQQESGEVRTRERQRRVEESLADLGNLWIDIVSNHWSDKRAIRNKRALGGFDMFQISKNDFDEWRWSVMVVPGSTAPTDKESIMTLLSEASSSLGVQIPPNFIVELLAVPGLSQAIAAQEQQMLAEQQAATSAEAPPTPEMGVEAPPPNPFEQEMANPLPDEEEFQQIPDLAQLSPEELAMVESLGGVQALP
jgi:hypothetical protein